MPELIAILEAKSELDHADKKFLAAIQGVDLDKETGQNRQDEWTAMKERVFGKQQKTDPNDVTSLRGQKAAEAGFGIGMGLNYERVE
jgi:fumarylacetoacetate (FAA) hydrolase family protein